MKNIAIFASGKGTNTKNLIEYFKGHEDICIRIVVSDKADAGVLDIANQFAVETWILAKHPDSWDACVRMLKELAIDLIVLAGFMSLLPAGMIAAFEKKIINLHPSLLPKYGGKGFYAERVFHETLRNKDREAGISIHYVNENYDEGEILLQEKCLLTEEETVHTLKTKIQKLEYRYLPLLVETILLKQRTAHIIHD